MTIIKHGTPTLLNPVRRFECPKCKCVFEAEFYEYKSGIKCGEFFRFCECPECGHVANEATMRE